MGGRRRFSASIAWERATSIGRGSLRAPAQDLPLSRGVRKGPERQPPQAGVKRKMRVRKLRAGESKSKPLNRPTEETGRNELYDPGGVRAAVWRECLDAG